MPMMTTLNEIKKFCPSKKIWEQLLWKKLLKGLGKTKSDDEPLLFSEILRINGFGDALWCLRAAPKEYDNKMRLFAVSVARNVQHLMKDQRSLDAIDVAERYAKGNATEKELAEAREAATAAAWHESREIWAAVESAAGSAAEAAKAAVEAAAGYDTDRNWEEEQFLKMVNGD
jgi:hypothetical protein